MRETFHVELTRMTNILLDMTDLVQTAMSSATSALLTADLTLAESVISGDARIDALHRELEDRSMEVLALHHPVAGDLRTVIGGLRMVSSLERMGDLARHVATIARMRYPDHAVPAELEPVFAEAGHVADIVTAKAGALLIDRDIEVAAELASDDDRMDALHRRLFARILHEDWTFGMEAAIDVVLLGRFYERYADHAVSLANRMVQLVTGELPT
jgi:phosphate transport system protein